MNQTERKREREREREKERVCVREREIEREGGIMNNVQHFCYVLFHKLDRS